MRLCALCVEAHLSLIESLPCLAVAPNQACLRSFALFQRCLFALLRWQARCQLVSSLVRLQLQRFFYVLLGSFRDAYVEIQRRFVPIFGIEALELVLLWRFEVHSLFAWSVPWLDMTRQLYGAVARALTALDNSTGKLPFPRRPHFRLGAVHDRILLEHLSCTAHTKQAAWGHQRAELCSTPRSCQDGLCGKWRVFRPPFFMF